MFDVLKNAFKSPELRKKILYTLLILVIFRIGSYIPVPFANSEALMAATEGNSFLGYLNMMSGGAFNNATLFAMSITPYINASIIIQLLTVAIPALERLSREGGEGRKKINRITRYVTAGLAIFQAIGLYFLLRSNGGFEAQYTTGWAQFFVAAVVVVTFTAGASLIMWLGEQINDKGLGNGISIILFAGIIARGPDAIVILVENFKKGGMNVLLVPLVVVIFAFVIVFIVIMTNSERRIPVQYAKRVVGRKMYGGQSSYIPIKISMSGVMPIIFASAFLSLPGMISLFYTPEAGTWQYSFLNAFSPQGWVYGVLYFFLIIAFNFFYVTIQYNPVEIANGIKSNNGAIPGIRPGKPTVTFISKVISKISLLGALFLGIIAVFPIVFTALTDMNISLGGTSIIILVGVAQDTMRQLESQLTVRHHKGFLA
ncbi:MAG: preprotein translocase subunit SecY [Massiliimalia sp.]